MEGRLCQCQVNFSSRGHSTKNAQVAFHCIHIAPNDRPAECGRCAHDGVVCQRLLQDRHHALATVVPFTPAAAATCSVAASKAVNSGEAKVPHA